MLLSMDAGISALSNLQNSLNVTANNIANVETTGFKSATVNFADTFNETLAGGGAAGSQQIGTGMSTSSITNQFSQGSISSTGNANDMAITSPNGFFLVKDPSTLNTFATRDGSFSVDPNGYLVTSNGMRVQGYNTTALSGMGDIKIDNTGATITDPVTGVVSADTSAVKSFSFGTDGTLKVTLADNNTFTRGQVLLQNFTSPQQLQKVGDNLYGNLTSAGPLTAPLPPGSNGLGALQTGALEMSNVDLAQELTSLITTQRAYEANSKVITTSNDILQTLINLKQG
jgi:flagellar hook protein FlgE